MTTAMRRLPVVLGLACLAACADGAGSGAMTVALPGRAALESAGVTVGNSNTALNPNTASNANTVSNPNVVGNPNNFVTSNRIDAFSVVVHGGNTMTPVSATAPADANSVSVNVPAGAGRIVDVLGLRNDTTPPLPTYYGSQTVTLQAGVQTNLSIDIAPAGLLQGAVAVTSAEISLLTVGLNAINSSGVPIYMPLDSNDVFSQPLPVGHYTVQGTVTLDGQAGAISGNPNFDVVQGEVTTVHIFVQLPGGCDPKVPLDHDGDGVTCDQDCDDTDVNNWKSCTTCVDADKDHWRVGCDAYQTILGPDCDDTSANNWVSCNTCVDVDQDNFYVKCDAYATISGPDCNDNDRSNWVSCNSCIDADTDGSYVGCDAYFNRHGPDCNDKDINNWVSCQTCQDFDGDGFYVACDQYASVGADCNDFDAFNWHACSTCVDNDGDGYYVGCDKYNNPNDQADCNDRFYGCNVSCTTCVPQAIEFAAIGGDRSITVNWDAIGGAKTYNLYVGNNPNTGPTDASAQVLTHVSPPFVVRGVQNGTPYYVTLTDVDGQGTENIDATGTVAQPHAVFGSVVMAAVGNDHALALKADGTVWAWGLNPNGQLGINGITASNIPVQVVGLPPIVQIAAGGLFSLALDANGNVWGWGDNTQGGITGSNNQATPALAVGLSNITQIGAGTSHAVALDSSGGVWAWGDNNGGEIGNGTGTGTQRSPVHLTGLGTFPVTSISVSGGHSLAVDANHVAWSWGSNAYGEVGSGATAGTPVRSPAALALVGVSNAFATQQASFAVLANGTLFAWGNNTYGALGNASGGPTPAPFFHTGGFLRFAGAGQTLALDAQGRVFSFGDNTDSALGRNGGASDSNVLQIPGLPPAMSVVAGVNVSMMVGADGSLWVWGSNAHKQLGLAGAPAQINAPTPLGGVSAAGVGDSFSVALRSDGTLWTWGNNASGQLGSTVPAATFIPGQVPGVPAEIISTAAGSLHALAVDANGVVWAWGDNSYGQLGQDSGQVPQTNTPMPLALPPVHEVAAASDYSLAIDNNGKVWVWGDNSENQFGNNTLPFYSSNIPQQVPGISGAVHIAAGAGHALASLTNGSVWAWGDNGSGQLGAASDPNGLPVQAMSAGMVYVAAGGSSSMARSNSGDVYTWGDDSYGQLADGGTQEQDTPVAAANLGQVQAMACGDDFAVYGNSSYAQVWGDDSYGQFGDGTVNSSNNPGQPVSFTGGVTVLATGSDSSFVLAVDGNGLLHTWGDNTYGQLGVPVTAFNVDGSNELLQPVPQTVTFSRHAVDVRVGLGFSVALANDGTVWTWGDNTSGALGVGLGSGPSATYPVHVPITPQVRAVAASDQSVFALDTNGTLWVWGGDNMGQLGDGTVGTRAMAHVITGTYSAIAAAGSHTVALDASGNVFSWGDNTHGQVGNNSTSTQAYPDLLGQTGPFTGVGAGSCTSFGWNANQLTSWGCNSHGELGNGSPGQDQLTPNFATIFQANIVQLCGGLTHTAVLLADGSVHTWGDDTLGQLGDGNSVARASQAAVPGLPPIREIACGPNAVFAVGLSGGVWAWGTHALLSGVNRTPVQQNALAAGAPFVTPAGLGHASLAVSASHVLLQNLSGALVASGDNSTGALGNGTHAATGGPVVVQGL